MKVYSLEQVEAHASLDSCWMVYKGKVYDVTPFAKDHPGGQDIFLQFAGADVSSILSDISVHEHSDSAYDLLEEYCIGVLSTTTTKVLEDTTSLQKQTAQLGHERDRLFLDLNKPLFPQLWHATYSKAFYLEQVHRPRYTPHYVPYFADPVLDILSRTTWYTVPMLWLPFILYQLWCSLDLNHQSSAAGTILTLKGFMGGVFFWTLLEYGLHRFLFHLDDFLPDHPIALLVHFTLHGIHHYMPMDRLRLVMPPALTIVISFPIFKLANVLFMAATAHAFMAGAFFGYVCYDMVHYYLHHAKVMELHFKEMKRYHLAHHYKDFESGFGITSKLWDYVFGTVLELPMEETLSTINNKTIS
ncbi:uncharacterized protein BX664DRAFT_332253 [Halteromyces radiatus]|uniref:uncharacterized protein n=1 Tax=Halteromyces radiatus TaxID=101107 RepID=UPI00221EC346|nr:uncharacterized protein BX664DRAFT_332253 [Halteromyces radiatus]KAI8089129.1 hypothetical protein BX664DRAFT_332253 [Halteromyces radiatus]